MITYLITLAAGIGLLLSAVGWGCALVRALRLPLADFGLALVLGLGLEIVAGGLLNLLGAVNLISCLCMLLPGIALGAGFLLHGRAMQSLRYAAEATAGRPIWRILLAAAAALLVVRFLAAGHAIHLNADDDLRAYLVFPAKMAQTGSMGIDPFSGRRNETSLGGTYFLSAMLLFFTDQTSAYLVDGGVGLIALWAVFAGLLRAWKIRGFAYAAILFVIAFVPPPKANVTSLLLSAAFAGALFRLLAEEDPPARRRGGAILMAGLLAGAVSVQKSSMIPPTGLMLGIFFLLEFFRRGRESRGGAALIELAAALGVAGVCMLPWMLAMYPSAATPLFPFFGQGHRTLAMPVHMIPALTAAKVAAFGVPYLALAALLAAVGGRRGWTARKNAAIALLAATGLGAIGLGWSTSGVGFVRLCYPCIFTALLVFALLALEPAPAGAPRRLVKAARACAYAIIMIFLGGGLVWGIWRRDFAQTLTNIADGAAGRPLVTPAERASAAAAQASVPAGKRLLVSVEKPFLLDFQRNEIWISDIAGVWTPPPHFSDTDDYRALARLLQSSGIRYVAFDYTAYQPWREILVQSLGGTYPWTRAANVRSLAFYDALLELGRHYRHILDDGDIFVLDLEAPAPPA